MPFPPFPWTLRPSGTTLVTLHPVALEVARRFVPAPLRIVPVWPRRTLGGLYLARYGPGSVLEYGELVACCAVVWHDGRPCAWATHVYVDDPVSAAGGREGLGAPKELARFDWSGEEGGAAVFQGERPVCTLRPGRPLWLGRRRVRFCAMHTHAGLAPALSRHGNEVEGRFGVSGPTVEIPPGSPLRALELGRPLVGICGREVRALLGGAPFLPFRLLPAEAGSSGAGGRRPQGATSPVVLYD